MHSDWELKSAPNTDAIMKTTSIFKGERDDITYGVAIINSTYQAFFRLIHPIPSGGSCL